MPLRQRPLSPHLQVYRPQLTSVLSILHRMSGIVLSAGLLMMSGWVVALALGEYAFDCWNRVIGSVLGQLFVAGWVLSLYYHLANGVRHLLWDLGYCLELPLVYFTGKLVIGVSVLLTVSTLVLLLGS